MVGALIFAHADGPSKNAVTIRETFYSATRPKRMALSSMQLH
jgi:hypothetical protein